jgi:hypothetical protein
MTQSAERPMGKLFNAGTALFGMVLLFGMAGCQEMETTRQTPQPAPSATQQQQQDWTWGPTGGAGISPYTGKFNAGPGTPNFWVVPKY